MGTRGLAGFVVNGAVKATYNHFDSYFSQLGRIVAAIARRAAAEPDYLQQLRTKAAELRMVDGDSTPTAEEIEKLKGFADLTVSRRTPDDWYCLLRDAQPTSRSGDKTGLELLLDAGVMIDSVDFAKDSLFCEYGYLLNLDDGTLEVYRGFQRNRHNKGRFADAEVGKARDGLTQYYPIALLEAIPFADVPDDEAWNHDLEGRYPEESE